MVCWCFTYHDVVLLPKLFETTNNEWHKVICYSAKRLIKNQQEIWLLRCTLTNDFKQQELALTSTESSREFPRQCPTSLNGGCLSFLFIDVPVGKLGRVKVGNFTHGDVWSNCVVLLSFGARNIRLERFVHDERCEHSWPCQCTYLPNISAPMCFVGIVDKGCLARPRRPCRQTMMRSFSLASFPLHSYA